ncbi:MAG: ATP-dependent DNA helicase RecG [Oscillospiraceae bacterium]|jgi:ATP-dependent DNA helicase RecG
MSNVHLKTKVRYLKGVGETRAAALAKLGIETVGDLLSFYPHSYDDRSVVQPISTLKPDTSACIFAMVTADPRSSRISGGRDLVKLRVCDDTGSVDIAFFNQGYVKRQLLQGNRYYFYGKIGGTPGRPSMTNPLFEKEGDPASKTRCIVPIYPLTAGISQKVLSNTIRQAMEAVIDELPDVLPEADRLEYQLCCTPFALENIHFPRDIAALSAARRRLIFEELYILSCALRQLRGRRVEYSGIPIQPADLSVFYAALPFSPTSAQCRAIEQAIADLHSERPMNRLVQGDVGSGKTLVAAALIWYVCQSGLQCAFMAPTEILARQHYATLTGFLEPFGLRVGLLTGSMTAKQKRNAKEQIACGFLDLVIGTHALISDDVQFSDLGLVVTDEQHRFGVAQRSALSEKGHTPHTLVMSATPIPRTLALLIYGDLDVSIIDELPPGRQTVDTFAVGEEMRQRIYAFIRRLVGEGRQVFIVCPMVEESEADVSGLKSAVEYATELQQNIFPDLRIACVHGKMKGTLKDAVMTAFVQGEFDILVSTTVIEVGVDVPNAALMIVENAERFGLSQLHQLRGRVGRGSYKSYCVLFSCTRNEDTRARLRIMTKTNDGFQIAEEDLRLRGPGDFFGTQQHGLPEMHIADLCTDVNILKQAQHAAARLLQSDPNLALPEHQLLRQKVEHLFTLPSGVFN